MEHLLGVSLPPSEVLILAFFSVILLAIFGYSVLFSTFIGNARRWPFVACGVLGAICFGTFAAYVSLAG